MAGLRERGYVRSEKGHGWWLDFKSGDCFEAHPKRRLPGVRQNLRFLAIGNRMKSPDCLVEQAVNAALGSAFEEAEAMLLSRFAEVTARPAQR